jgi:hypothetical protein
VFDEIAQAQVGRPGACELLHYISEDDLTGCVAPENRLHLGIIQALAEDTGGDSAPNKFQEVAPFTRFPLQDDFSITLDRSMDDEGGPSLLIQGLFN